MAPEPEPEEEDEQYTREEIIMAFIASPRLPKADKLIMGHISSFTALASMSEGPTYKQAVKILSLKYVLPSHCYPNLGKMGTLHRPAKMTPPGRGGPREGLCHCDSLQALHHGKTGQRSGQVPGG